MDDVAARDAALARLRRVELRHRAPTDKLKRTLVVGEAQRQRGTDADAFHTRALESQVRTSTVHIDAVAISNGNSFIEAILSREWLLVSSSGRWWWGRHSGSGERMPMPFTRAHWTHRHMRQFTQHVMEVIPLSS